MFTFKNIKDINDLKNFIGKHVGIVAMVCGGFQFSKEEEIAFFSEAEKWAEKLSLNFSGSVLEKIFVILSELFN